MVINLSLRRMRGGPVRVLVTHDVDIDVPENPEVKASVNSGAFDHNGFAITLNAWATKFNVARKGERVFEYEVVEWGGDMDGPPLPGARVTVTLDNVDLSLNVHDADNYMATCGIDIN